MFVNPEPSPTKAVAETVAEVLTKLTSEFPSCIVLLRVTVAL